AMQFEVSDKGAIRIADQFYQGLVAGQRLESVVTAAREHVSELGSFEWGTPVLYLASPNGVLFEVEKQLSPPTPLPHAVEGRKTPVGTTPASSAPPSPSVPNPKLIYDQAGDFDEAERYAESIPLYEQLLGLKPPYREGSVRTLLAQAQELLKEQQKAAVERAERERVEQEKAARQKAAQDRYSEAESLVKRARTDAAKVAAREAIQAFTKDYPEYKDDPQVAALWKQVELTSPPAPLPKEKGEITPPAGTRRPPQPTRKRSVDLLPAPFGWIEIPKKGYSIAKYPLTNAQFAPFIEAGGYTQDRWWTKAGLEARQKGIAWDGSDWKPTGKAWTEPRYWQDAKWNGAEHPVVGVSWFEAVAFCLWLSEVTGEKIMLPTEDQWQYAAQGTDGRDYPWGKKWDASRCNNNVDSKSIGITSPVRQYEGKGDSPFGVVDMSGNVWEWCLTDYNNKTNELNSDTNRRVLRGGSWGNDVSENFRCDCRSWYVPVLWNYGWGFRLALS
ncbi:partial Serine/threonine-protein kinase Pkn1, partial [Anaerolineae bacterium]